MQTELFANRPPEHSELGWNQFGTPAALLASISLLQWQNMCTQQCVIEYSTCMRISTAKNWLWGHTLYAAQNMLLGGWLVISPLILEHMYTCVLAALGYHHFGLQLVQLGLQVQTSVSESAVQHTQCLRFSATLS
jgi:hypothetical protein